MGAGPLSLTDDVDAGVVVARAGVAALLAEEEVVVAEDGVLLFTVDVLLGVAVLDVLAADEEAGRAVLDETVVFVLLVALLFTAELLDVLFAGTAVAGLFVAAGFAVVAVLLEAEVAGRELVFVGRALVAGRAAADD